MAVAQGTALYDSGFYNTSVTPTTDDLGRGNQGAFGEPLAFARQALFERLDIPRNNVPILGNDYIPARDEDLGLAVCEDAKQTDADMLLRAADAALYRAKRAGRNRVEVWEESDEIEDPFRRRAAGVMQSA